MDIRSQHIIEAEKVTLKIAELYWQLLDIAQKAHDSGDKDSAQYIENRANILRAATKAHDRLECAIFDLFRDYFGDDAISEEYRNAY